jgi:2-polyprenyl-3-methyl-5-hydroxy-6-metoxy-1,4-benzoquinol methylase
MIGKLLKELMHASWRYVSFQVDGSRDNLRVGTAAPTSFKPTGAYDWQILRQPSSIYGGGPPLTLLDLLSHEPKFILDVGCSSGDFAAGAKLRFPRARVWGIEPNKAAARLATPRIDRVLCQTIERINWNREGVKRGNIDTVFLFDVLEHIYDPWSTLLQLRNLVSKSAELIVSIPNVRNVLLMQDLISGTWRYRRAGLLDITHIRFFTSHDMHRMFYQTGFRVLFADTVRCAGSSEIYEKYRRRSFPVTVQLESAAITAHSLEDLESLCALQHIFVLQPAEYGQLSPSELHWIDAPHPDTVAYSPD